MTDKWQGPDYTIMAEDELGPFEIRPEVHAYPQQFQSRPVPPGIDTPVISPESLDALCGCLGSQPAMCETMREWCVVGRGLLCRQDHPVLHAAYLRRMRGEDLEAEDVCTAEITFHRRSEGAIFWPGFTRAEIVEVVILGVLLALLLVRVAWLIALTMGR